MVPMVPVPCMLSPGATPNPDRAGPASASPALRVTGITKSYDGRRVLRGVDLTIEAGEICGLLGLNGAGKTSLMSIIAGTRRLDEGTIEVAGRRIGPTSPIPTPGLGYAPQTLGIYPTLTVEKCLLFFAELHGVSRGERRGRVHHVAEAFGLSDDLSLPSGRLSGGQQRRLHTAMAILHRPPLLLLDEVTTGVDVESRLQVLRVLRMLADEDGTAICYATHYLPELRDLGATVAMLHDGRIVERGSQEDVIARRGTTFLVVVCRKPVEPPPGLAAPRVDGSTYRFPTTDPTRDLATVVSGIDAADIRSIAVVEPSLDALFLEIAGKAPDGTA